MAVTRSPERTESRGPGTRPHVLVPLDGSDRSLRALPVASALAERVGGSMSVFESVPRFFSAEDEAAWMADAVAGMDVADRTVQVASVVVPEILAAVEASPGTVLCMSTHGRSGVGEVLLGSVTRELILQSTVPVIVVGPHAKAPTAFDTLQVCVDGSRHSERTLDVAGTWAALLGAIPWVTHVVAETATEDPSAPGDVALDAVVHRSAAMLQARGLAAEWDVLHGRHVADTLAAWAVAHGTDLLAIGSHSHPLVERLVGTVTTRLLHVAPCPVLVVGPNVAAG